MDNRAAVFLAQVRCATTSESRSPRSRGREFGGGLICGQMTASRSVRSMIWWLRWLTRARPDRPGSLPGGRRVALFYPGTGLAE